MDNPQQSPFSGVVVYGVIIALMVLVIILSGMPCQVAQPATQTVEGK